MPQVYFTTAFTTPEELLLKQESQLSLFCKQNNFSSASEIMPPGKAYSLDLDDPVTPSVVAMLNFMPAEDRAVIRDTAEVAGDDLNTLAKFFTENLSAEKIDTLNGLVGAGMTAAGARLTGFQRAILDYEKALVEVNKASRSNSVGGSVRLFQAEGKAHAAYRQLQTAYHAELNRVSDPSLRLKNRGNALSNVNRGLVLSKRSPNSAKVDPGVFIRGTREVRMFQTYARIVRDLGRAAVFFSAALGAGKVITTRQEDGDWLRESTKQMARFGVGGAAGGYAGKTSAAVTTSLGGRAVGMFASKGIIVGAGKAGLVAAGPIGWGVLAVAVGVGLVVGWQVAEKGGSVGEVMADRTWQWSSSR